MAIMVFFKIFELLFIDFRDRGRTERRERERERHRLVFHLFMHTLVDSCVCPDWGPNMPSWTIGKTLSATVLPG